MTSLVEKATSDLLIGPDWALNLELCDCINSSPGQAKDVIKAVKKRISNKNSKVQFLALTVLETLIKNCSDVVHKQVAEKDVLTEMVKIVKKKTDMNVRDKILVLLDSWQEAFGGVRGKYPQYYAAYDDLRKSGVEFPQRDVETAVPIFTPPQTHPITPNGPPSFASPGYMPPQSDAVMALDVPSLSLAEFEVARSAIDVLNEMLNALDPQDKQTLKGDLIMDLIEQCHSFERKVMQLVNTTSDEELLCRGLALNDDLQKVLAKHQAMIAGSPLPLEHKQTLQMGSVHYDPNEETEEFSQLAHRSSYRSQGLGQDTRENYASPKFTLLPPPPPPPFWRLDTPPTSLDLLSGDTNLKGEKSPPSSVPLLPQHTPNASARSSQNGQKKPHGEEEGESDNLMLNPWATALNPDVGYHRSPWKSNGPTKTSPQTTPKALGKNIVPNIPPPPVLYTQRQKFFRQQLDNNNNPFSPHHPSLEQQTHSLSLEEDENSPNRKPQTPPPPHSKDNKLFEDLVDLGSIRSANFKAPGMSSSSSSSGLPRPSVSKTGSS